MLCYLCGLMMTKLLMKEKKWTYYRSTYCVNILAIVVVGDQVADLLLFDRSNYYILTSCMTDSLKDLLTHSTCLLY